jgi:hypothetical protein
MQTLRPCKMNNTHSTACSEQDGRLNHRINLSGFIESPYYFHIHKLILAQENNAIITLFSL